MKIPVRANGDVFSPEDARAILEETGVDGLMVARGALGNPFLFRQILSYLSTGSYEHQSFAQRTQIALRQARLAIEQKGETVAIKEFRKHAAWYVKGMPGAAKLRQEAVRLSTYRELEAFFGAMLECALEK